MKTQRGGFVLGMVVGLLVGLAMALGVALYITKAPIPFINKVPQRTAEQDTAETERNRSWDPNAPLGGKAGARAGGTVAGAASQALPTGSLPSPGLPPTPVGPAPTLPAAVVVPPRADPAAILSGSASPGATAAGKPGAAQTSNPANPANTAANTRPGADPYFYFVQAGAFTRSEEADQQRARLALAGYTAKVTEREQAGRTVYRVRMGPFPGRDDAESVQVKLQEAAIESQLVRVEKP